MYYECGLYKRKGCSAYLAFYCLKVSCVLFRSENVVRFIHVLLLKNWVTPSLKCGQHLSFATSRACVLIIEPSLRGSNMSHFGRG